MHIRISIPAQTLELLDAAGLLVKRYSVSTAKNGAGEQNGSYRTPRGRHVIRAKIGAGLPENSVFVRRRPTGELCTPELMAAHPQRDWILTRILWLSGCEPGFNRLGEVDTMRRYIYLHGSPDSVAMGTPGSIGCVRMRNADIIDLFDRVPPSTPVSILEARVDSTSWAEQEATIRALRREVFVRELQMAAPAEFDEWDPVSFHILATGPDGQAIGVARMLPHGYIGHLAVLPSWRNKGVGQALLESVFELACRNGLKKLVLHAKAQITDYYARFGFVQEGDVFIEADRPHVMMLKQL